MEYWKAGQDVMEMMRGLIAKHHPHLALIEDEITIVFKDKAAEKAGLVIAGNTKKAPSLMSVLTDKKFNYRFVIEIGADAWSSLSDRQRHALIDHHLCAMLVEEDKDGALKCSLRPPDFFGYKGEFERWGMWRPMDDDTLSVIEDMFGEKAKEGKTRKSRKSSEDLDDLLEN